MQAIMYMVKRFLLNLLFGGCLFTACSGGSSNTSSSNISYSEDGVTVIPMNAQPGDVLNLSDFAESIELIPLETTDDCLIGWIPEIIATENYYYMISAVGYDFQKLYVYDKQGKFVRQISSRGQGGNEFLEVRDFDVIGDSIIKMGDVFVIRTFNFEGKELSAKLLPGGIDVREITSMKGRTILFIGGKPSSRTAEKLLFQLDEKDSVRAEFFEVPSMANRVSAYFVDAAAMTKDDESVYFHFPYDNFIYQIDAKTLEYSHRYKIDYGSKTFTWDMFDENGNEKIWSAQRKKEKNASMTQILSLNDYFLFTSRDNEKKYYFSLYSNQTGKVLNGNQIKDDMYFKGNMIVFNSGKPGAVLGRLCNDGGDLIWPVQPKVLLKGYEAYREVLTKERWELFCKKYPRLVEVCEQLKHDDNPVLLKIKLKDF